MPLRWTAALCVVVASLISFPLSDYDFFWHVATGELILQDGRLPASDPFAFTGDGRRWLLEGWLSQVLFATAQAVGDGALRALATVAVLVIGGAVYGSCRTLGIGTNGAAKLTLIALVSLLPFLTMRPILFTYACFALTLLFVLQYRSSGDRRWLWSLVPLFVVWVNLHPAFAIGYALLGAFVLADLLQRWAPIRGSGPAVVPVLGRPAVVPLGLLLLASFASPYGFEYPWLIAQKTISDASTVRIEEWMPLNPAAQHAKFLLFMIVLYFLGWMLASRRPRWDELLLPIALVAASFRSTRFMAFAVIALSVCSAPPWAAIRRPLLDPVAWLRFSPETTRDVAGRPRAVLNLVAFVAGLGVAVMLGLMHRHFDERALASRLPVGAMRFVEAKGIAGNVFNDYNAGGYIIRKGYPRQRVFIDTRYTLHPSGVRDDYLPVIGAAPGWGAAFGRYPIDYVLIESRAPLRQVLIERGDFRLVYSDGTFSVLVKALAYPELPSIRADLPADVKASRRRI